MADEAAIRVESVFKDFILPHEKAGSVKNLFTGLTSGLHRKKETQHALKNISFEIKKGEFFGIVGRNGSGKSTLLKILAGIYQPTSGKSYVSGKLVPFIELGVGFNAELTGRENVYLNGAILGFSRKEVESMYESIVEFAELGRFMDQKLKNYSSGMQVRLAFSMAIRAKADILLVDEVLAVGDAAFQRKCFDYFKQLKGSDTTVIFVSHNMNDVREYCDRALLIDQSEVVDINDSDTIAKQYSQLFINDSAHQKGRPSGKRWGNRTITYDRVSLENDVLTNQKELVVNLKLTSKQASSGLIVGFAIKNAAKQSLIGSNNLIEGQPIRNLAKNQSLTLQWTVPNIFADGNYTIDATIVHSNGEESDWWEEAASFTVARESEHAPYIVAPPLDLKINNKE